MPLYDNPKHPQHMVEELRRNEIVAAVMESGDHVELLQAFRKIQLLGTKGVIMHSLTVIESAILDRMDELGVYETIDPGGWTTFTKGNWTYTWTE